MDGDGGGARWATWALRVIFPQEREEETWDESLKRENKVILVQITRTSPRRILS